MPVIHFPCITDKSYFHLLCGHHIPVLSSNYAPRRKSSVSQPAKWLNGEPPSEATVCLCIHFFHNYYWMCQPVPFWQILVQARHISSVSWVDTTSSETDALFFPSSSSGTVPSHCCHMVQHRPDHRAEWITHLDTTLAWLTLCMTYIWHGKERIRKLTLLTLGIEGKGTIYWFPELPF